MKSVSRVCIIALLMSIYQTMPMNAQAYEIEKEECVMFARNNKDGTVNSGITNILGLTQKFNSIVDPEFDRHCNEDRNNNGWVIYEYNPTTDNCTWYTTNLKTITIKILFNYLDKTGFIDI